MSGRWAGFESSSGGARVKPELRRMVRSVVEPGDYGHDRLR